MRRTTRMADRRRSLLGPIAVFVALAAQIPSPTLAGPFDPGGLESAMRAGGIPVTAPRLAAGVSLTLPFQTAQRGKTALAGARLAVGLGMRPAPALAAGPALPARMRAWPVVRLSVDFTGRPDSLRLNGLPLLSSERLAAGENASDAQTAGSRTRKTRKWLWIGAGFLAAAAGVAIAGAVDDNSGKKFFRDDMNPETG